MNRNRIIEALVRIAFWISIIVIFVMDASSFTDSLSEGMEVFVKSIGIAIGIISIFFMPSKMADRNFEKGLKWLNKDNDKAVVYFEKYLASKMLTDIERRNGLRVLGVAHHERGDDEAAISCLKEALEGQYKDNDLKVELLGAIGIIYSGSGDYQIAVEYFDKAFEIIFATSKAHIDKTTILQVMNSYIESGKKEKAVNIYDRLLMIRGFKRDKRVEELLGI